MQQERIHKDEGYRGLQLPGVTHLGWPNTDSIFFQKIEIKGTIKQAVQEEEMLLS